jgi:hypothetical protein
MVTHMMSIVCLASRENRLKEDSNNWTQQWNMQTRVPDEEFKEFVLKM